MEIYLDNSATTKVCEQAAGAALELMTNKYGNPSSLHTMGFEAEKAVRDSAETLAGILKCKRDEIIFTSGGSESDNLAIIGGATANKRKGRHLITTKIEHPAVLQAFKYLEEQGFETSYLGTDENGIISLKELENTIREDTILVSIMHVNNEIGSVQPIEEAGNLIKLKNPGCLFHVDDVQGFSKLKLNPGKMKIDLMSVSGHKIHAPKGTGFLFVKKGVKLNPIIFGGGQQGGVRSGTENVPGIAALAAAADFLDKNADTHIKDLYENREFFISQISDIEGIKVNGPDSSETTKDCRAPHIISLSVRDVRAEVLLHALEEKGIYVSAGSACSSHKRTPSATLMAIGLEKELLESTVRLSMSVYTTRQELEYTAEALKELIPALRRFVRK